MTIASSAITLFFTKMDMCEQLSSDSHEDYDGGMLLADEERMMGIVEPHHHDVLCGRGVTTNRHPGNESFRSLVGLNKVSYFLFLNSGFHLFSSVPSHPSGILVCHWNGEG